MGRHEANTGVYVYINGNGGFACAQHGARREEPWPDGLIKTPNTNPAPRRVPCSEDPSQGHHPHGPCREPAWTMGIHAPMEVILRAPSLFSPWRLCADDPPRSAGNGWRAATVNVSGRVRDGWCTKGLSALGEGIRVVIVSQPRFLFMDTAWSEEDSHDLLVGVPVRTFRGSCYDTFWRMVVDRHGCRGPCRSPWRLMSEARSASRRGCTSLA